MHHALEPYVNDSRTNPEPHPSTRLIEERRAAYRQQATDRRGTPETMASVSDGVLNLANRVLKTRLYVPPNDEGRAVVLFLHGGSFVLGDLDTHDALCRRLARDTGMRFLALDYRLAPEYPFPAALDDALDALRYVATHVDEFAAKDARLVVMGDSAGATLIAAAAALTRDEGLNVAAQVLIYPTLGPELVTDSAHVYGSGFLLEIDHLRYDYEQYLGEWTVHSDPRVSPLLFENLTGAPPAIVMVAECDPLRDEAVAYAGLLEHFGVSVEILEAKGMVHGFLRMGALVPEALEIVDELARHLHQLVERNDS